MKTYFAKTLFSGVVVGKDDKKFVGVPGGQNYETKQNFSKEKNFKVIYDNKVMQIKSWHKAEAFRKFDDMNGRGTYTLGYFEWKPIVEPEMVSGLQAMKAMAGTPSWELLRKKLHSK